MAAKKTTAEAAVPEAPGPAPAKSAKQTAGKADGDQSALRLREAARLFAVGAGHHEAGELDDAVAAYERALGLNSAFPEAFGNLGAALRSLGKTEAAVACHRRAIQLAPERASYLSNLGNALRDLGRLEEALAAHRQGVRVAPKEAAQHRHLGETLLEMGNLEGALKAADAATALDPGDAAAQLVRARALLLKGDFKAGFEAFEARFLIPGYQRRRYEKPLWNGAALKGRTVLVTAEQGFADILHYARYLPGIKQRGGNLAVQAPAGAATLVGACRGVDKVVLMGADLPRFDLHMPMMSLARLFHEENDGDGDTAWTETPYLAPPDEARLTLPPTPGSLRVGIAWGDDRRPGSLAGRPPGLAPFMDLTGLSGLTFFSLQRGPTAVELQETGSRALIFDLARHLDDLAAAAAAVQQMDLVIAADQPMAHLAGALGKPVWLAAPVAPDWRWGLSGRETRWYPSMRIFRAEAAGAWDPVFARIKAALRSFRNQDRKDTGA